jgi:hypothetical protein
VLPNFLHVGSAKAASTWLYQACLEHPEVYAPPRNDNLNFFVVHYHEGLNWYRERYFAEWRGEKAAVDFSNSYLISELALQRIARDLPEARLTGYFEFLGVDASYRPGCLHRDINPDAPESDPASLSGELRAYLEAFYREDIEALEALIGRDLSAWRC